MTVHRATPELVRAVIATQWLGAQGHATLGTIVLRPHQRSAASRLRTMLQSDGGAMLADPVGLGKTYTALAAARGLGRLTVIAPAALRDMWRGALRATGIGGEFVSYQSLSRGRASLPNADVVMADEAHHVRNPATKRYRAIARLCTNARVLLLTATPVHNRTDELRAQLALFLGQRAWSMDEDGLQRYLVKRDASSVEGSTRRNRLPRVARVRWYDIPDDEGALESIVRLPPPLRAQDAGDGGPLIAISLIRQWGSSRAALDAGLRTRLARAEALVQAFAAGRHPTRAELRAWCYSDGALQLAFPELASSTLTLDAEALLPAAQEHQRAVRALRDSLRAGPDPDDARAEAIRAIRHRHPGEKMVVFAEFTATVEALYARLKADGGVAMLTHHGGKVPGGRITRREVLGQFAPGNGRTVPPSQRIDILVATDLLSEGVNLQNASVVVHADLPWSPARCEQRIGRVRRLASPHDEVFVYALRPPASAGRMLQIESRLRRKIADAARAVGVRGTIMPRLFPDPDTPGASTLQAESALITRLEDWLLPDPMTVDAPVVAGVAANRQGFLALVRVDGRRVLLAGHRDSISDAPEALAEAAGAAVGTDVVPGNEVLHDAMTRIRAWCDERASLSLIDLPVNATGAARRRLLRRIDTIASRSPRHLRSRYAPLARQARRVATQAFGSGAEQVLEELAQSRMPDEAWLNAVRTFADLHATQTAGESPAVVALLLFVPTCSPAAAPPP